MYGFNAYFPKIGTNIININRNAKFFTFFYVVLSRFGHVKIVKKNHQFEHFLQIKS